METSLVPYLIQVHEYEAKFKNFSMRVLAVPFVVSSFSFTPSFKISIHHTLQDSQHAIWTTISAYSQKAEIVVVVVRIPQCTLKKPIPKLRLRIEQ